MTLITDAPMTQRKNKDTEEGNRRKRKRKERKLLSDKINIMVM
jgi:hypothetical protein